MKVKMGLAISTMAIISARAGQAEQWVDQRVIVYVENSAGVPFLVLSQASVLAADMFAGVGVRIYWRAGQPAEPQLLREGAIAVRLTLDTPKEIKPSVGAFADTTSGVHITVLCQHLTWALAKPDFAPLLLAHVLVHEITHIVEGIAKHSETGIMKADWTPDDYYDMQKKPLPFASEDVDLIHRGLAQRRARVGKVGLEQ